MNIEPIKAAFRNNLFLKIYAIACSGLLLFYVYSAFTGYKWFAGKDTVFSPGGPSGVSHK